MALELMTDLETLAADAAPNAVVLSIGAVLFDPAEENSFEDLHAEGFEIYLDPQQQLNCGIKVDWSTILWWQNQEAAARTTMFNEQLARSSLHVALTALNEYVKPGKPTHIWGNGPSFDCAILHNLYKASGVPDPFKYYQQQCVRTIGKAAGLKRVNWGVQHNALDDAVSQAVYVQRCYKKLGLSKE
jgi:hypothetical protein